MQGEFGVHRSQYLTDSDMQHLPLQRSIRFTASLTHSASLILSLPLPLPSLPVSHSLHLFSTILPLQTPLSISLSPFPSSLISSRYFSLLHSLCLSRGMQYVAGCGSLAVDTRYSAPGWVTFIGALTDTVLEHVCVFRMCCIYCMCSCMSCASEHSVPNNCALRSSFPHRERVCWCVGRQEKWIYFVCNEQAAVWNAIIFTANCRAELCIFFVIAIRQ